MRHFCTYADHRFLPRALALVDSLKQHGGDFRLWFLCLSPECREWLDRLRDERIQPVSLEELEAADPDLLKVKPERSRAEYIFTLTAAWMGFLFDRQPEIDLLTYLDADLYFFGNYEEVFQELGDASIGIIEHRHARTDSVQYGRFNVGWVSIRRDEEGVRCVRRWREQCIEWCHDHVEDGKYGDQKYLDEWPERYRKVCIIEHPGANLAPWNLERYELGLQKNCPTVDERSVIFYHFSNMRFCRPGELWTGLRDYGIPASIKKCAARFLYQPYVEAVSLATHRLREIGFFDASFGQVRDSIALSSRILGETRRKIRRKLQLWRSLLEGENGDRICMEE